MIHRILVSSLALAWLVQPASATDLKARLDLEPLIVKHAAANNIPAGLVHRIIIRESRYNARAVGLGGALGLMQIKHATARALGYSGSAEGLLDADTNLTYGVRYLAGAYRVADGDQNRAVGFYARGYYYDAKRRGMLGTLARAPAVAQEPVAAVAAPPPAPPQSFFSTLFSTPQPSQAAAQAAVEEPEPVITAPRTKRAGKRQAAGVETGRSAPVHGERGEAVRTTGGTGAAPAAGVDRRAVAVKETAALPEAAAPPRDAAVSRGGRPAKRTTVSGADRSAQKASAQPDDPGTNP
jgi:pyruvate/2-oxoglutarate dehydrogenase complex dihydrolipoamide acyltransferase (E2) component